MAVFLVWGRKGGLRGKKQISSQRELKKSRREGRKVNYPHINLGGSVGGKDVQMEKAYG